MATSGSNGKGEAGVSARDVETVVLTYDRAADHMEVGGKANSLDLMLDMLARATRVIELKWRQEEQKKFMAELQDQARASALAAGILGKR